MKYMNPLTEKKAESFSRLWKLFDDHLEYLLNRTQIGDGLLEVLDSPIYSRIQLPECQSPTGTVQVRF